MGVRGGGVASSATNRVVVEPVEQRQRKARVHAPRHLHHLRQLGRVGGRSLAGLLPWQLQLRVVGRVVPRDDAVDLRGDRVCGGR